MDLLGPLFTDGEEGDQLLSAAQARPVSVADEVQKPPLQRVAAGFAGLMNQYYLCRGATCYLNSLLQALYMTPEFREAIYRLDLCVRTYSALQP